jgi:hypothetical protein
MPWVILELASYLSKQKKYSFLSPLLVAAVVGLVRLRRNLCASGASPDQQPSKISAVVGRKNQCERVRLWRMEFECAKSYQYWPKEQVYERGGGGILFVPTESGRYLSASGGTCAPLTLPVRLWRNLCASGASPDQQHCMMDISPQSIPLISE